jgi:hypothetical protein
MSKGGILSRDGERGLLEDSDWGHDYRVERSGVSRVMLNMVVARDLE